MEKKILVCKHCGEELKKVLMPPDSDWGVEYQYICLNDECGYYIRGWDWMRKQYNVNASYRFRHNPFSGDEGPMPVATSADLKHYVAE
jgi:hypothetical protein